METFGLKDLAILIVVCGVIGLVSAVGPAIWRALPALFGGNNPRRPMYHIVKGSVPIAPNVMSRSEYRAPVVPLSSKDGQIDGRTDSPQPSREELLTLYRILRKYGVSREEIRPALKAVHVPLSNDVWAQAAPAERPAEPTEYVTPIAGRPTRAVFETDPDYPYQPPN